MGQGAVADSAVADAKEEMILAVDKHVVEDFIPSIKKGISFYKKVDGYLIHARQALIRNVIEKAIAVPRNKETENNPNLLQIIPYCITIAQPGYVFLYKRGGESSEERLKKLWSIGIGGHVNVDKLSFDIFNNAEQCIVESIQREYIEETGFEIFSESISKVMSKDIIASRLKGIVYDPTNSVGSVHLGFVFSFLFNKMKVVMPGSEFDKSQTLHTWIFNTSFKNEVVPRNFETWSQLIIDDGSALKFE